MRKQLLPLGLTLAVLLLSSTANAQQQIASSYGLELTASERDRFKFVVDWKPHPGGPDVSWQPAKRAADVAANYQNSDVFGFHLDRQGEIANFDVIAKILNGCRANGHFWVIVNTASMNEWRAFVVDRTIETEGFRNRLVWRSGDNPPGLNRHGHLDVEAIPCD